MQSQAFPLPPSKWPPQRRQLAGGTESHPGPGFSGDRSSPPGAFCRAQELGQVFPVRGLSVKKWLETDSQESWLGRHLRGVHVPDDIRD